MTYSKLDGLCVLLEGFVKLLGLEERLIPGQCLQSKEETPNSIHYQQPLRPRHLPVTVRSVDWGLRDG